jgi:signal transduction histidine kinase
MMCVVRLRQSPGRRSKALCPTRESVIAQLSLEIDLAQCTSRWSVQVLFNLVGNACKFTRRGHVTIALHYGSTVAGVGVSVTDSGCGVPSESLYQIFDAYDRAHAKRDYGGSGLGLHVVKEIVHAHGGFVEVASELGAGSCFIVWLPLSPDQPLLTNQACAFGPNVHFLSFLLLSQTRPESQC